MAETLEIIWENLGNEHTRNFENILHNLENICKTIKTFEQNRQKLLSLSYLFRDWFYFPGPGLNRRAVRKGARPFHHKKYSNRNFAKYPRF